MEAQHRRDRGGLARFGRRDCALRSTVAPRVDDVTRVQWQLPPNSPLGGNRMEHRSAYGGLPMALNHSVERIRQLHLGSLACLTAIWPCIKVPISLD
ncbi:hypothetical protein AAFF_G00071500 [Aldrovandia affinis]|uniref:Uncharacterized protein n=1 Tax=Aldrovandia affinis TaxID=143900 RepID=A0AAD7S1G9_9TELE|nr:hypothetical protein AAFF_G00071500 [Aldrovandia affinis]